MLTGHGIVDVLTHAPVNGHDEQGAEVPPSGHLVEGVVSPLIGNCPQTEYDHDHNHDPYQHQDYAHDLNLDQEHDY